MLANFSIQIEHTNFSPDTACGGVEPVDPPGELFGVTRFELPFGEVAFDPCPRTIMVAVETIRKTYTDVTTILSHSVRLRLLLRLRWLLLLSLMKDIFNANGNRN